MMKQDTQVNPVFSPPYPDVSDFSMVAVTKPQGCSLVTLTAVARGLSASGKEIRSYIKLHLNRYAPKCEPQSELECLKEGFSVPQSPPL